MSDIKIIQPPKNRIVGEYEKICTLNLPQEERLEKIYEFYNKYFDYFEKTDEVLGNSLIASWISIKIVYIRILDDKEKYEEAWHICQHLPILLEKLDKEYYKYKEVYLLVLRWQGVILGRKKKYIKSNQKFEELLKIGNENSFCKKWMSSNYSNIIDKYVLPFALIAVFIMLWNNFQDLLDFHLFNFPQKIRLAATIFSLIYLVVFLSLEKIIMYLLNKKYKQQ